VHIKLSITRSSTLVQLFVNLVLTDASEFRKSATAGCKEVAYTWIYRLFYEINHIRGYSKVRFYKQTQWVTAHNIRTTQLSYRKNDRAMRRRGTLANICIPYIIENRISYIFAADSMGLSSFKWSLWALKDPFLLQLSAYRPFKVIQDGWFWYQSKAHMRLPISPS